MLSGYLWKRKRTANRRNSRSAKRARERPSWKVSLKKGSRESRVEGTIRKKTVIRWTLRKIYSYNIGGLSCIPGVTLLYSR